MRTFDEWCKAFADIEKDPKAKMVPRWTIRDLIEAKIHYHNCAECRARMDRVEKNAPPEKFEDTLGKN